MTISDELESAIDSDTLDTRPSMALELANIIEQFCKSSSTHTPFSQFSATFQQHQDQSKSYYSSPVGKFWDRSASSSGSSENRLSSNPELTCFPIEEDPTSNEESDTGQLQ
ncbi:hypothetical protein LXL04_038710 [Taraxacum kok-saghyz]